MKRHFSTSGPAPHSLILAAAAMACVWTQVGCISNRVEMPRASASHIASTQEGSVSYASARCFLYRRDDTKPQNILQRYDAEMEREDALRQGLGFRCGRPVSGKTSPLLARTLALGETFGFRRDAAGKIVAIAGEERILLAEGRYAWEIVPLEYTGEQATAKLIFELLTLGFRGPVT